MKRSELHKIIKEEFTLLKEGLEREVTSYLEENGIDKKNFYFENGYLFVDKKDLANVKDLISAKYPFYKNKIKRESN